MSTAESGTGDGAPRGATRRRGEELEREILDAVLDELAEVGYARLTIEGVAARARTGRGVLYRRWPNRAELVVAALGRRRSGVPVPDTGALRHDLVELLRAMAGRFEGMRDDVVRGVMAEAVREPGLSELVQARVAQVELEDAVELLLARADARGEVNRARITPRMRSLPLDLLRNEFVLRGGPVGEEVIAEIVDEIVLPLLRTR
ncbi:TetR/AcrR family transcriptional regulator [Allonocardiopsis opalescens]|uniref:TetR family transcriptional regulator n=1 Tax=Allonocardiopsis opalescens TaxID=1144618 RepID=A0A2T0Q1T2_9ACTN|nr:TetR/AcrR family transcriptional regulator [Allonocardiopsis opalescens]PRX97753.1 TetR family transcriptional regulator [Allonocardiopsis opalescens]